jgi:hypothetical protein
MTRAGTVAALVAGLLVPLVTKAQGANAKPDAASPTAERLPIYAIDPTWPPTLPNDWILGDIRGLFVDDPRAYDRDRLEEPDVHRRGRQRPAHAALDSQRNEAGVEREAAGSGTLTVTETHKEVSWLRRES